MSCHVMYTFTFFQSIIYILWSWCLNILKGKSAQDFYFIIILPFGHWLPPPQKKIRVGWPPQLAFLNNQRIMLWFGLQIPWFIASIIIFFIKDSASCIKLLAMFFIKDSVACRKASLSYIIAHCVLYQSFHSLWQRV